MSGETKSILEIRMRDGELVESSYGVKTPLPEADWGSPGFKKARDAGRRFRRLIPAVEDILSGTVTRVDPHTVLTPGWTGMLSSEIARELNWRFSRSNQLGGRESTASIRMKDHEVSNLFRFLRTNYTLGDAAAFAFIVSRVAGVTFAVFKGNTEFNDFALWSRGFLLGSV